MRRAPLLTMDERKNVVELVMERVKANLKAIMVGDAVELAPAVQLRS